MNKSWTSFWIGTVVAVFIAIGAGLTLQIFEMPSEQQFASSSTRL